MIEPKVQAFTLHIHSTRVFISMLASEDGTALLTKFIAGASLIFYVVVLQEIVQTKYVRFLLC